MILCRNCLHYPCYRNLTGQRVPCFGFVDARPDPWRTAIAIVCLVIAVVLITIVMRHQVG